MAETTGMDAMSVSAPPPSVFAATNEVRLQDCIEELLKFTLLSFAENRIPSSLSCAYCADLLRDDPSNPIPPNDVLQSDDEDYVEQSEPYIGLPSYPLYKRLASSLYGFINSGTLCVRTEELTPMLEDERKYDIWNKLIVEEGNALMSLLKEVNFKLQVQEPFFSHLHDGLKTIEGRCAVDYYKRMKPGDFILLNKCVILQVQDVRKYASFADMLGAESLTEVLPGIEGIEEALSGVKIYRTLYSEEKEISNGVLAICLKRVNSQLYKHLASIFSGLNYEGIQRLLGIAQTTGTISKLLPPPPSTLLSSFLTLHKPHRLGVDCWRQGSSKTCQSKH